MKRLIKEALYSYRMKYEDKGINKDTLADTIRKLDPNGIRSYTLLMMVLKNEP